MKRDIFLHTFTLTFTCRDTYDHYIFHIFHQIYEKAAKNCQAKTFETVATDEEFYCCENNAFTKVSRCAYSQVPILRPGLLNVTTQIFPPKLFFRLINKKHAFYISFFHPTNFKVSPSSIPIITYNRSLRVGLSLLYSINSSMSKSHLGILGL